MVYRRGMWRAGSAALLAVMSACGVGFGGGAFIVMGCSKPEAGAPDAGAVTAAASVTAAVDGGSMKSTAADEKLAAFAASFLGAYLEKNPTRATQAGEHRYDGRWPDLSAEGEALDRTFIAAHLAELDGIPEAELSVQSKIDRGVLDNQLRYWLYTLDSLKDAERDPMLYTGLVGDGLDPLVTRDFAPLEERMTSLRARLEGVPALVAAAKKRLQHPSKIHTETAIEQNAGLIALCEHSLAASFAKVPAQQAALTAAAKVAAAALEDYQTFLTKDLLPRSDGDFRLGRSRFEQKLRFELDDAVTADSIAEGARALLVKTQEEMADTARELWADLMKPEPLPALTTPAERQAAVRRVLDKLAADHPDNATILAEATTWLDQATAFVRDHDLVRLPTEPCKVIEMPEYRRGVAVAYCDASGPLEKKQETFFAIAPTPADWPKKRVDSFFREYNRSMLAELTVHEAMPGHFLQLMHNNEFPSKLRSVFASGAFVEGWAVYTEWLMAKYGFGGPKVRMMRQKMVLRLSANAILDHGIHAGTMDEKEALSLMMHDAFQEEGEAVGKWKRARLSSAQLTTYYYGFTEMMKLRAAHEKAPGFSELRYHDKLTGFGSPSLRALRTLMAP
jgi:uncharacterized protein (DUF885 family)